MADKTMPIGDLLECALGTFKVVEDRTGTREGCRIGCDLFNTNVCGSKIFLCSKYSRTDHTEIVFKKVLGIFGAEVQPIMISVPKI